MDNEEFIRLEQLVDTLIENYSDLKEKYSVLEESLQESERERDLLKTELAELQDQRSEIGRRISGLLGRIEQWESDQGLDEQEDNQHVSDFDFDSESDAQADFSTDSSSDFNTSSDLESDADSNVGFDSDSTPLWASEDIIYLQEYGRTPY